MQYHHHGYPSITNIHRCNTSMREFYQQPEERRDRLSFFIPEARNSTTQWTADTERNGFYNHISIDHSPAIQSPCISPRQFKEIKKPLKKVACPSQATHAFKKSQRFTVKPNEIHTLEKVQLTKPQQGLNQKLMVQPLQRDRVSAFASSAADQETVLEKNEKTVQPIIAKVIRYRSDYHQWKPPLNISEYKVLDKIGRSTWSVIYKIEHSATGQVYALKCYRTLDQLNLSMLQNEIQIQSTLDHPHILKSYGMIQNSLLLDYCDQPLTKPITGTQVVQLLKGICYLHGKGIIHRDLKPENIMLQNGQIQILDFGLSIQSMQQNQYCGNKAYMAPEVAREEWYTSKADCYSIGKILSEYSTDQLVQRISKLLCNENPIERISALEALRRIQNY